MTLEGGDDDEDEHSETPLGWMTPSTPVPPAPPTWTPTAVNYLDGQDAVFAIPGEFTVGHDGSAQYEIKLQVPPNRAGLAPNLGLSYDSGQGNGFLGVGWRLNGITFIGRCPRTVADSGVHRGIQLNVLDQLCFNGRQPLVQVAGTGGAPEYRTMPDANMQIKISAGGWGPSSPEGPISFEVRTPDDLILSFGGSSDATVLSGGVRHRWLLRRVEDRFGNRIEYEYEYDEVDGESYLSRILYGAFASELSHDKQIEFQYASTRLDQKDGYRWGETYRVSRRLDAIEISLLSEPPGGVIYFSPEPSGPTQELIRRYDMVYQSSPSTGRTLLTELHECVPTSNANACKRPTRFDYGAHGVGLQAPQTTSGGSPTAVGAQVINVDINGDGRHDMVFAKYGTWRVAFAPDFTLHNTYVSAQPHDRVMPIDYNNDGYGDLLVLDASRNWIVLQSTGSTLIRVDTGVQKLERAIDSAYMSELAQMFRTGTLVLDMNGDGALDVLQQRIPIDPACSASASECPPHPCLQSTDRRHECSASFYFYRNTGSGFAPATAVPELADLALMRNTLVVNYEGDAAFDLLIDRCRPVQPVTLTPSAPAYVPSFCAASPGVDTYDVVHIDEGGTASSPVFTVVPAQLGLDTQTAKVVPLDVNGDRITDFLTVSQNLDAERPRLWLGTGKGYTAAGDAVTDSDATAPTGFEVNGDRLRHALTLDYNGDGLSDVLVPVASPTAAPRPPLDVPEIGRVEQPENFTTYVALVGRTDGLGLRAEATSISFLGPRFETNNGSAARVIDVDGDGHSDVLIPATNEVALHVRPDGGGRVDALIAVHEGQYDLTAAATEAPLSIRYGWLSASSTPSSIIDGGLDGDAIYFRSAATCTYPCMPLTTPRAVVAEVSERYRSEVNGALSTQFRYEDAFVDRHGRGWLGFRSMLRQETVTSAAADPVPTLAQNRYGQVWTRLVREPTFYDATFKAYPLANVIKSKTVFGTDACGYDPSQPIGPVAANGRWADISRSDHILQSRYGGATYAVLESRARSYAFECLSDSYRAIGIEHDLPFDALVAHATPVRLSDAHVTQFDNLGFPLTSAVEVEAPGVDPAPSITETRMTHAHDISRWLLGRRESEEVTQSNAEGTTTRVLTRTFDGVTGRLRFRRVATPDDVDVYTQTELDYDRFGNVIRNEVRNVDNQILRQSAVTFEPDGVFPHAVTNGLGHTTYVRFERRFGVKVGSVDPNGIERWFVYDTMGRPRYSIDSTGIWTQRWSTRQPSPSVFLHSRLAEHEQSSFGTLDATVADAFGRPLHEYSVGYRGQTYVNDHTYNDFGQKTGESRGHRLSHPPQWTSFTYDRRSRVEKVMKPDGVSVHTRRAGTRTWTIDGLQEHSSTRTDGLGRMVESEDDNGHPVVYRYGPFSTLVRIDAFSHTLTSSYDSYGRKMTTTDPNAGVVAYKWDALGQMTEVVDARGMTTTYCYDALGRRVSEVSVGSTRTWSYDLSGSAGIGLLAQESSSDGLVRDFVYDAFSRLERVVHRVDPGTPQEEVFESQYTYNGRGALESYTYPTAGQPNLTVQYRYDDYGHLTRLQDASTGALLWKWRAAGPENQVEESELGNGAMVQRLYHHSTGLLRQMTSYFPVQSPFQDKLYTWDANRNLEEQTDLVRDITETFGYDNLNRLVSWTSPFVNETYTYAADGNVQAKPQVPALIYDVQNKPHAVREANNFVYGYDMVGNQEERPAPATGTPMTVVYSEFNKPKETIGEGVATTFQYDADQYRFRKNGPSGETLYIDGLFERKRDSSGQLETRLLVVSPIGPVAMVRFQQSAPGATAARSDFYLHTNLRGSLEAVTDSSQSIVHERSYTPFGLRRHPDWSQYGSTFSMGEDYMVGFTGHEDEDDLGWINMSGRLYDPKLGRFMNVDPIVGRPLNGQNYNRYSYVLNNPMTFTDPTGLDASCGPETSECITIYNQWGSGSPQANASGPPAAPAMGLQIVLTMSLTDVSYANIHDWRLSHAHINVAWAAESTIGSYGGAGGSPEGGSAATAALKIAVEIGVGFTPLGIIQDAIDIGRAIESGDRLGIAIAVLALAPGLDALKVSYKFYKVGKTGLRPLAKAGDLRVPDIRGATTGMSSGRRGTSRISKQVDPPRACRGPQCDVGSCFVAGTLVMTPRGPQSIEEIQVGERVLTTSGGTSEDDGAYHFVRLQVRDIWDADHEFDVHRLLTDEQLQAMGIEEAGATVDVRIEELGVQGEGVVVELRRGVRVQGGAGRLVLSTVSHLNNDVYEVSFVEGGMLRPTGRHPLYSVERGDWVRVRDLQVGERLQTAEGAVTVRALEKVRGVHRVYNLEVEGDHEYLVGEAEVRAHNSCVGELGGMALSEAKSHLGRWGKSSFETLAKSVRYHARKHGFGDDVARYLRKASSFNKKGSTRKVLDDGAVRYRRKSGEFLIERDGKIVSYGLE